MGKENRNPMSELRTFRIVLSLFLFAGCLAYLFLGLSDNYMARLSEQIQIIPSAIASTIGVTLVWLAVTFALGRVYCSTACPVGTLQDTATWLRRKLYRLNIRRKRIVNPVDGKILFAPYRFRKPGNFRLIVLLIYLFCLVLGILGVATLIEPWNMMASAARISNPEGAAEWSWLIFCRYAGMGAAVGSTVLVIVWLWALFRGRRFCAEVCPIGTVLSYVSARSLMHIEIDPDKCIGCLRCEEVCKAECIKVVSRYVDNSQCVRCFDCLKVCSDDAIRYQRNRNRRATPLLRRRVRT